MGHLSLLTAIFQVNPGLPVFIEASDDGGGGDNWTTGAISRAKQQPNNHHQQTNIQFFTGRMPFLLLSQQCQSIEGKYHIPWTCLPQAHLGFSQLCFWPLIAPGYLVGGLPCLSSAIWCQYPMQWAVDIIYKRIISKADYTSKMKKCWDTNTGRWL